MNYPDKESCLVYASDQEESIEEGVQKKYRFFNIENLARECAKQPNTITFLIDNACRNLPDN